MKPMNDNVSYLMIYRFDQSPQLNSSIRLIDGWTLFCSSSEICMQKRLVIIEMSSFVSFTDLINDTFYRYFINNQQTKNHRSFIFGFRQLTENELIHYCSNQSDSVSIRSPPMTNQSSRFTTNYRLRLYTSSCLYFDDQDQLLKSDGLVVRDRDFFGKFSRRQNFIWSRLGHKLTGNKHNVFRIIWQHLLVVWLFYRNQSIGVMFSPMLISWETKQFIWLSFVFLYSILFSSFMDDIKTGKMLKRQVMGSFQTRIFSRSYWDCVDYFHFSLVSLHYLIIIHQTNIVIKYSFLRVVDPTQGRNRK